MEFTLLLVEDDAAARDLIGRMVALQFPSAKVYTAEDGRKGVEAFKQYKPDIVITDINMPGMDGIEMAREIRSLAASATYIVLTAYSDKGYFDKFQEIGFCSYLMKPIDFKELFATIEKCIAERECRSGPG